MWTGRHKKQWLIVLGAILLAGCSQNSEPETPQSAWWYEIVFAPVSTTVRNVDIRTIDPSWESATALDQNLLEERVSEDDLEAFAQSPLAFSLLADLDGDGIQEEFFVGVYRATDGEYGRFVSILREERVIGYFKESGVSGFSALMPGAGEVRWYKCMECGEFESIAWGGESYLLE